MGLPKNLLKCLYQRYLSRHLNRVNSLKLLSENQFYWQYTEFYEKHLANLINPYMLMVVDRIVEDNPTIVGFSLYTTSLESSIYLIKKIRERLPNVKIGRTPTLLPQNAPTTIAG